MENLASSFLPQYKYLPCALRGHHLIQTNALQSQSTNLWHFWWRIISSGMCGSQIRSSSSIAMYVVYIRILKFNEAKMHMAFNPLFIQVLWTIHIYVYIHKYIYSVWDFALSVRYLQMKKLKILLKWGTVMNAYLWVKFKGMVDM